MFIVVLILLFLFESELLILNLPFKIIRTRRFTEPLVVSVCVIIMQALLAAIVYLSSPPISISSINSEPSRNPI